MTLSAAAQQQFLGAPADGTLRGQAPRPALRGAVAPECPRALCLSPSISCRRRIGRFLVMSEIVFILQRAAVV